MTSPVSSYSSATSSTASIGGLVSGLDTTSIISQLMQIEAQPQNLLKTQLANTQTDAAAYRDVNTSFAALATAAQALTQASTWSTAKATPSDSSVTATASAGATTGSFTFSVAQLAAAQSSMANTTWANSTDDFGLGSTLTIKWGDGTTSTPITITSSDSGAASLDDAVAAINKSGLGLAAAAIKTDTGYALQVTATATGTAKAFTITSDTDTTGSNYTVVNSARDAKISFANGSGGTYTSTSSTNTFGTVLPGVSFTVSQVTPAGGAGTTISVATDPDAIANAVQTMVTAANAVLSKISKYTDNSQGSTAPLKSDWSLISLTGRVLDAVSTAVGTSSAGSNGLQLTKDGQLTFDPAAFKTALAANPALVQQVFSGSVGVGADNVKNTPDDTVDVDGVAARLQTLADQASDSATGILTTLANGQDTRAKDLQDQIAAWDLRLQQRQQTLQNQFNAMETALGTLKSQSSWLSSQIGSLYNPNANKS